MEKGRHAAIQNMTDGEVDAMRRSFLHELPRGRLESRNPMLLASGGVTGQSLLDLPGPSAVISTGRFSERSGNITRDAIATIRCWSTIRKRKWG